MRFLLFVVLLLILGTGAAWYFEWIDFSVARDSEGSLSDVNLKINRDRINEDLHHGRAAGKTTDAVKEEKTKIKEETVRGTIRSAKSDQVTLDVGGKAMTVKITSDTKISMDGREGKAVELRPGQDVRCTHLERGGEQICLEMVVLGDKK